MNMRSLRAPHAARPLLPLHSYSRSVRDVTDAPWLVETDSPRGAPAARHDWPARRRFYLGHGTRTSSGSKERNWFRAQKIAETGFSSICAAESAEPRSKNDGTSSGSESRNQFRFRSSMNYFPEKKCEFVRGCGGDAEVAGLGSQLRDGAKGFLPEPEPVPELGTGTRRCKNPGL